MPSMPPGAARLPCRWAGSLVLLGTPTVDGRLFRPPPGGTPVTAPLPLPLYLLAEDGGGVSAGRIGVIEEVRQVEGLVLAVGSLDLGTGGGRRVGSVLAEGAGGSTVGLQVLVDQITLADQDPADSPYGWAVVYEGWRIRGAAVTDSAAWPGAELGVAGAEGGSWPPA